MKKYLLFIWLILNFLPIFSQRVNQKFNFDWKFRLEGAVSFDYVTIPHDWSIGMQSSKEAVSGGDGGFFPMGKGEYVKDFSLPKEWQEKRINLYFEGVYMNAEIFINGNSLGVHPYGYTSFNVELSKFLNFGGENQLVVKVDNSQQKNCRWYSGSGIYRNVWLQVTDKVHVSELNTYFKTSISNVTIQTQIINDSTDTNSYEVKIELYNPKGKLVGRSSQVSKINSNVSADFNLKNPDLWSPEHPSLYQAKISVYRNNKIIDSFAKKLGIRTLEFSAEKGFLLNGIHTIINGGCVHHDNGALGAAAYDRAEIRKVELLKIAGFNAVRTSHNPPSESFLNACDSLGLLVIDEIFDGWRTEKNKYDYSLLFDQWWIQDVDSWVLRDRNRPSVVMWSIGNEIIERKSPEAVKTAKLLSDRVKLHDKTRPVSSAMTTWDNTWEIYDSLMAQHDVAGYNYQLHHAEKDHLRVPSRVIVQTESYPKDAFYCWDMVDRHSYIIGDFVWTAMDYLGESGIGRYFYPGEPKGEHWTGNLYPWHGAYCGDIDLTGGRKPISHYRSMLYNDTEKLYLAVREPNPDSGKIKTTQWAVWPTWESWTWPGKEKKDLEVEVYSKYPSVRLYLNGNLLGEKPTTRNEQFKTIFNVAYSVGELKAVGVVNGKEVERKFLRTAGEVSAIHLKTSQHRIKADLQDLSFVDVELVDENGILNPNAEDTVQFDIEGPGEIIAVSNANLKDSGLYQGVLRKAWKGRAQVVVRSTAQTGKIKLIAKINSIKSAIEIKSFK